MENRPLKFGARRIFGLDLSKKTLKACRLDEDSGVEKQNSEMTTSAVLGTFRSDEKVRQEFLSLIQ